MAIDLPILLRAYAVGLFPMADDRAANSVFWVEPERRAILPLDGFHLSKSLRKTVRANRFEVTADTAFEEVIALCAQSASDRPTTWINRDIEEAFVRLHHGKLAHSVEVWSHEDGERHLVGGLYGLALGRAFFGESMFSRRRDASKVAIAWLVARLRVGGFTLLDCQFMTPHLASLGAVEIDAQAYSGLLGAALSAGADGVAGASAAFDALDSLPDAPADRALRSATRTVSGPVSGQLIAQLITQTS
ncbi:MULTISPECIES: leucyl/phenylalanyl-tRNA--protein transferase [Sphingobium]|uniref:leucyl/phenylalanyl-tRNA--protein transferase n=1 Tax=Sphingobium TaxID=165695 RepID=UPI0015EC4753|nr:MULTISPECIES: leucyl/phenylalanyl-tRNA--protein transferase [Sphingobium]MCW2361989.1 leucyl/phenylalanyl-tRNA--protein transferase [Sphingobium sp. B10D3B]MCW2381621.1 leucyl/phenylalanyl-tRNA--protein transferase [Sphingobium sp. B2D3B]MCW2398272.1 leucyl/phenylalanyl-tRNA--protein transferase [Sphingobium sp. B2D3C]MCW2401332.1 leucyl/phenylalanyl-tRNA--protein transferase [Sphingobium sp. B10D7B]MCW2408312.1 leucyl/phenylalanyl-tRNA--protein transferase [Sphingobium xanthum]